MLPLRRTTSIYMVLMVAFPTRLWTCYVGLARAQDLFQVSSYRRRRFGDGVGGILVLAMD